jgi:hypothetical protein
MRPSKLPTEDFAEILLISILPLLSKEVIFGLPERGASLPVHRLTVSYYLENNPVGIHLSSFSTDKAASIQEFSTGLNAGTLGRLPGLVVAC